MLLRCYRFCPMCGSEYPPQQQAGTEHTCPQCQFTLYENQNATASAVVIYDQKLLLVKRARDPYKGKWDFPGGFVEVNEHPQKAVVREVQEELGVSCHVNKIFGVYGPTTYIYQQKENINCDLYYLVTLDSFELKPADDVADFSWFTIDAIPPDEKIAFPVQLELLRDIRSQPNLFK